LRRGLQDYEYLWLLEQNHRPAVARRVARDLCRWAGSAAWGHHFLDGRPGGWVTDPKAWGLARRLLAEELTVAMSDAPQQATAADLIDEPAELDRFKERIEWARFRQMVRETHVAVEGVRVRPREELLDASSMEVMVSVANFTSDALSGALEMGALADDWLVAEPPSPIENLLPTESVMRRLRVKAAALQPNAEGVTSFDMRLRCSDGQTSHATGRLALVESLELARPVTIDGRLDDWPLGAGNVAGDFRLVGTSDVTQRSRDKPTQATTVFVAHDDTHLYIAFLCEDDALRDRRIERGNAVHYDGLWPSGEDLIEVVLDPTGRAEGPEDLLHIVVKANGAVVTQRGFPCLEQVAAWEPWAGGVTAAVGEAGDPDRWTVEVRVPLSSLGGLAECFGVNFARFLPRLGEYASWSGAGRFLYSPFFLGNIRLSR
jgi:hypothetical protein